MNDLLVGQAAEDVGDLFAAQAAQPLGVGRRSNCSGRGRTPRLPHRTGPRRRPCRTSRPPGRCRSAADCGPGAAPPGGRRHRRPAGRAAGPCSPASASTPAPCSHAAGTACRSARRERWRRERRDALPLAMMTDSPATVASRAARSLLRMPPEPRASCALPALSMIAASMLGTVVSGWADRIDGRVGRDRGHRRR